MPKFQKIKGFDLVMLILCIFSILWLIGQLIRPGGF